MYVAMVTHAETRKKTLVDKFYKLGLCISYDVLMQVSTDLGNHVGAQFEKDESYSNINPVEFKTKKDIFAPKGKGECKPHCRLTDESMQDEIKWLEKVERLIRKNELGKSDYPSWASHFASQQTSTIKPSAISFK